MIEALRPALFSQMIVVPLFHRHRILTQVAADNMNVVKLLPPLIAGDDEVELFADALDDVLSSAQQGSSLYLRIRQDDGQGNAAPDTTVNLGSGDRVLVTGASGFIGSAVTRQLVAREQEVVALVEPGADTGNLDGLDVKQVVGDLRNPDSVRKVVSGCRAVFHVAALYRFWASDPDSFYDINVGGTRNVLGAAAEAGVERMVYTSTVGTLGLEHVSGAGSSADERSFPDVRHLYGSYKRSKYVAEHEVLRAIAEGLDASLVLPTFPLGPGDRARRPPAGSSWTS